MSELQSRRTSRLQASDEILPWRRAEQLEGCALYWMPVRAFPMPDQQRAWLTVFIETLARHLAERSRLRCESFLQMSAIYPELLEDFKRNAFDTVPLIGLSWSPSAPPPAPPAQEVEQLQKKEKAFSFGDHVADYCYWFLQKPPGGLLQYLGRGGMTLLFLPPDPNTAAPQVSVPGFIKNHPHFQAANLDGLLKSFGALKDGFTAKSKELFGPALTHREPELKGTLYVLPRLSSRDFFQAGAPAVKKWFGLFEVYLAESPADDGVVLATKDDFDDDLSLILQSTRKRGLLYPIA